MIDLATLFQAASEEHGAAGLPAFPVPGEGQPEEQLVENKDISGISGGSGRSEFPEQPEDFYETQARARERAGERARGSYVGKPETPETPEKRVPAGKCLSGTLSLNPEKEREPGNVLPLPAAAPTAPGSTFDERAAFLEYECGLSRAAAEAQARSETRQAEPVSAAPTSAQPLPTADGLALWRAGLARLVSIDPDRPTRVAGYRVGEWAEVYARAVAFLNQFGSTAEALGWTAPRLFGVHPIAGIIRVDACGALVLPVGGPIRAITATEIRFGHLTHREKPGQPEGVPIWEFGR